MVNEGMPRSAKIGVRIFLCIVLGFMITCWGLDYYRTHEIHNEN